MGQEQTTWTFTGESGWPCGTLSSVSCIVTLRDGRAISEVVNACITALQCHLAIHQFAQPWQTILHASANAPANAMQVLADPCQILSTKTNTNSHIQNIWEFANTSQGYFVALQDNLGFRKHDATFLLHQKTEIKANSYISPNAINPQALLKKKNSSEVGLIEVCMKQRKWFYPY